MESRDITSISLGILYGVLKTRELDLQQRKLGFGKVITISSSVVLVTQEPELIEDRVEKLQDKIEGNQEAELDDTQASVVSELFTLEELEELNYKTMPYMNRKVQVHQIQKESQLQIQGYTL